MEDCRHVDKIKMHNVVRHRKWPFHQEPDIQLEGFQHSINYTLSVNALTVRNDTSALVSCLVHGDQKEGMLTVSCAKEASCSHQQCNVEYSFVDTNFNGKRCSFEEEVQELGMKTIHTPIRCVHMQQVYMTGESLSSFSF